MMRRVLPLVCLALSVAASVEAAALADDYDTEQREKMVREQLLVSIGGRMPIVDLRVLEAMRTVPRHRFVPASLAASAYEDRPMPIGDGDTMTQPYITALLAESGDVRPGEKVLEIGTGSGYGAAVLARLTDRVYTIEGSEPMAKQAKRTLADLGLSQVHVQVGDGLLGWPEEAPFDAILVTAPVPSVPEPLADQLAERGKLVIPVGEPGHQELIVFTKKRTQLKRETAIPVAFVPVGGRAQSTMQSLESHSYEVKPPGDE